MALNENLYLKALLYFLYVPHSNANSNDNWKPSALDCSTLTCPTGYHCKIKNNERSCVCDTDGPIITDCSTLCCPQGYHCEIKNNERSCVIDQSSNYNNYKCKDVQCPIGNDYDSRCKDIKCQPGFECKYDPVKDEMCCVPINNCDDVRCPPDFECE
ncbi:hypothetical protein ACTFIT_004939 [Dictyostelium discoideum]